MGRVQRAVLTHLRTEPAGRSAVDGARLPAFVTQLAPVAYVVWRGPPGDERGDDFPLVVRAQRYPGRTPVWARPHPPLKPRRLCGEGGGEGFGVLDPVSSTWFTYASTRRSPYWRAAFSSAVCCAARYSPRACSLVGNR
ncbi:hypothetical protein [Streptomyces sp. BPTC-684]|uniref:hypothetical protein n=1 Tax=Streptomyces sp. BPTC-684 TaxID=3043734 RepID=UPI0024B24ADF|nr:hypothetical protein [Streptomyces sp. BPTC-684]WHM40953.1 hypothetical protein QIY60_31485 [Streptomyces sp. BPTC-684]